MLFFDGDGMPTEYTQFCFYFCDICYYIRNLCRFLCLYCYGRSYYRS